MTKNSIYLEHFEQTFENEVIKFEATVDDSEIDLWWSKDDGLTPREFETGLSKLSEAEMRELELRCLIIWRMAFGPIPDRKIYIARARIK